MNSGSYYDAIRVDGSSVSGTLPIIPTSLHILENGEVANWGYEICRALLLLEVKVFFTQRWLIKFVSCSFPQNIHGVCVITLPTSSVHNRFALLHFG